VGDSIIGQRCNVGAGTQFANLRFDEEPITVRGYGKKKKTERIKLGAIVEHDCKFGVNCVVAPGRYVRQGTRWVGIHGSLPKKK